MGPPRSGTSVTFYAMRDVFRLPGYGESHVFPIFSKMLHDYWIYSQSFSKKPEILASRLDTDLWQATLIEYVRKFYAAQFPGGNWVDKTPGAEAVMSTSLVLAAFPEARIILMARSGIDTVQSIRVKFTSQFREACLSWLTSMEAMVRVIAKHATALKVDQFDLASQPDDTAARIAAHLGRDAHAERLAEYLKTHQPERSSKAGLDSRRTLAAMDWSDDEKRVFSELCGDMMRKLGYPL
jgi:hypothetical protein